MTQSVRMRFRKVIRDESLTSRLIHGALGVGGLKLLSLPLTLLTSIVLARGLGPESFGQYSFILAAISLLSLPLGSGLSQLVTREVAKYHHAENWDMLTGLLRRSHQLIIFGSVAIIGTVLMIGIPNATWSTHDRWTLLVLGMPLLPFLGLNALRSATLRGFRRVIYAQIPDLTARPGFHLAFIVGLITFGGLNSATALLSQITATAIAFALGAWLLSRTRLPHMVEARPVYQNSRWIRALVPFTLLAAVSTFNGQIGILALGWLGTDADVAALRIAMNGAMLVNLSLLIVNMVVGPHVTRAHADGDMQQLRMLSQQATKGALMIALPIAILFLVFGGPIISFLYGDTYRQTTTIPLAILAFGQLMNVAFGPVGMFLSMSGFERDTLIGQLVSLTFSAIAAVALIPPFGAAGASIALVIGVAVWNIILAARFRQRFKFRPSAF